LSFSSTATASWYIKPSSEIPLRRGQGTDYKILAIVPDGTEVTILEEADPWVKVTTQEGKEGWVLKRYLSQEQPAHQIVEVLRRENTTLREANIAFTAEREGVIEQNVGIQKDLDNCIAELGVTREQHRLLLQDSGEIVETKQSLEQGRKTIALLQQQLDTLSVEMQELKKSQDIKWFLAGVGTLVLGCIVGMVISRTRRKKPSLY
jgi:SH3 domain protein